MGGERNSVAQRLPELLLHLLSAGLDFTSGSGTQAPDPGPPGWNCVADLRFQISTVALQFSCDASLGTNGCCEGGHVGAQDG